jgi:hypothetical protein
MVVLADRPAGGDAVLLVAEEVLDAEQDAALARLDRGDPARLALADDVGQRTAARNDDGGRYSVPVGQKSRW